MVGTITALYDVVIGDLGVVTAGVRTEWDFIATICRAG